MTRRPLRAGEQQAVNIETRFESFLPSGNRISTFIFCLRASEFFELGLILFFAVMMFVCVLVYGPLWVPLFF